MPSSSSIFMRCGTCCCSEPSGPTTATRAGSIVTVAPSGVVMGAFPILLIDFEKSWPLPDERDDLAADPLLLCGAARNEPRRCGQDRDPPPPQHPARTTLPP